MDDITVKFMDWACKPEVGMYNNGRKAMCIIDIEDQSPVATATVNIPGEHCDDDEIFVKDYSENEGMVTALMNAKLIKEPHRTVRTGFVAVPVCRLTEQGKALWEVEDAKDS